MIEDEQPIINDEMRMRTILADDFGVGKTVHHSFSRGEGERKGVDLLNYSCAMRKNNKRRKSS